MNKKKREKKRKLLWFNLEEEEGHGDLLFVCEECSFLVG